LITQNLLLQQKTNNKRKIERRARQGRKKLHPIASLVHASVRARAQDRSEGPEREKTTALVSNGRTATFPVSLEEGSGWVGSTLFIIIGEIEN
jgi:hypothetical protein